MKNETYKKNLTRTAKFFAFTFCTRKSIYIPRKYGLEKCNSNNYISSKVFFVLQNISNKVMKHQRLYKSAMVLQTSYFEPKYLAVDYVFNVGFDSNGLFFQTSEKYFQFRK